MSTAPTRATEPPVSQIEQTKEPELDPEAPALDQIISTFDASVNKLRTHVESLKPGAATTGALNDCLAALVALQAFTREIRRLSEDLL